MTFRPIQHRPPNKFIMNKEFRGECCTVRRAFYRDRSGKVKSVIAQVIWDAKK